MSSRGRIIPICQPDLPVKTLFLLALCLGGLSVQFLADNFEHFLWQPVAETSSQQADHDDHQEQYMLPIKLLPVGYRTSVKRASLQDSLLRLSPLLYPLLHPPKFL
jgi:hypothetical protein